MNENTYAMQRRNFLQWFFPMRNLPVPNDESDYAEGYITTVAICVFDWLDRLRILVSGKVEVKIYTKTDVMVNKAHSTSVASVLPPNEKLRA